MIEKMWKELKKICKKKCLYVFFTTTKFGIEIINSNPKWFKYDLVWQKSRKVGFLSANKLPLRKHEMLYVFGNNTGGNKTYNPQKIDGKPYNKTQKKNGSNCYGTKLESGRSINKGDRHPHSILDFDNPIKTAVHRTQKPVKLYEWLIKSYSNEGDIVMDFCAGSMTCAVACKNTNRKSICIEMNKEIYDLGMERLSLI